MYHHQAIADSFEECEAIEAVEVRGVEDLLDDIERREARRLAECDDCLLAMSEVPAAWIGRGARA